MAGDGAEPRVVKKNDLVLLGLKVTEDGGGVRYFEGARYGVATAVFQSTIVPGSGPLPHTHPYAEIFVVQAGRGTYRVGDETLEAEEGDVVIVPPELVHSFTSTGDVPLRQVAIHEHPSFVQTVVAEATADRRPDATPVGTDPVAEGTR